MFQGSFSYYIKRECYIQELEKAAEKKALKINLQKQNKVIKAENKKKQKENIKEAKDYIKEHRQKKPGLKLIQRHIKKNRVIV